MQKKGYTIPLKKKIPLTQVFYSVLCSIINIPQNFKISNYLCNLNPFFYIVTLDGGYPLSRWFELRRVRKNTPQGGVLVYPLGFEPRLDGVGGRNVIQLHYEYASFSKSTYILLFFTSFLQAFMV